MSFGEPSSSAESVVYARGVSPTPQAAGCCDKVPSSASESSPHSSSTYTTSSCASTSLEPPKQERNYLDDLFDGLDAPPATSLSACSPCPTETTTSGDWELSDESATEPKEKGFYFEAGSRSSEDVFRRILERFEKDEEVEKNGGTDIDRLFKELWDTRPKQLRNPKQQMSVSVTTAKGRQPKTSASKRRQYAHK